jgi:hypothetical protein
MTQHSDTTTGPSERAQIPSARQWGLRYGAVFSQWLRSADIAVRLLDDVCTAAVATTAFAASTGATSADEVLGAFPSILYACDELSFHSMAEASAYLAVHLSDRYCRVFDVLELLLAKGALPLGISARFAAIDVGAGPGPGIFAIRAFYAALAAYTASHESGWRVAPLGHADVVERGRGMSRLMHYFAEHLALTETGRAPGNAPDAATPGPHPCTVGLAASRMPFGASYTDFTALDLRAEHVLARNRLARRLNDELDLGQAAGRHMAHEEAIGVPSAVAIAVMTNFLTTTTAVAQFEAAIRRLMSGALVPGGVVLVLGAVGGHYPAIYRELDRLATAAGLTILDGFDEPIQAGQHPDALAQVQSAHRACWNLLQAHAHDTTHIQRDLRRHGAAALFDQTHDLRLPRFRVRAYRRGSWPGQDQQ